LLLFHFSDIYIHTPHPIFTLRPSFTLSNHHRPRSPPPEAGPMEIFYFLVFGGLSAIVAVLEFSKNNKDRVSTSPAFNSFKNNYLVVYSLMMAGDWLQGPYVYYLYTVYGYGKGDIGQLFIAGFGSSMLFGTIVGSGRKRAAVTYCITYILSCITKHSPQYKVLMLGRVLGGIATSLLFSAFESWLVAEHFKSDEKIALLGAIQSLFEGSMYTFVFLWTPALSPSGEDIPHGFIFATFMLASMLGSSVASRLLARQSPKVESYMQIVFLVSAAALMLPVVTSKGGGISFSGCIQLIGFCAFESCVGIFWPSIMKMRSQFIPEEARSTIMNFFRIPLNIFVCVVLYNVDAFPIIVMFGMCSIFLFVASLLQRRLMFIVELQRAKSPDWSAMRELGTEEEPLNA
ncbi:Molybdate-anion transporter, partial [Linum perenne]